MTEGVSQESPGGFAGLHMGSSGPGYGHTPCHWGDIGFNGKTLSLSVRIVIAF